MNTMNNPYGIIMQQQNISNMINNHSQNEIVWAEPPNMNDQEVKIVCAVLKILEAMGSIEAVQQQINYQHRPPGIISLLFGLLKCTVPTEVIAHTISCISSCIDKSQNQADKVWQLLDTHQILFTQRQRNEQITKVLHIFYMFYIFMKTFLSFYEAYL